MLKRWLSLVAVSVLYDWYYTSFIDSCQQYLFIGMKSNFNEASSIIRIHTYLLFLQEMKRLNFNDVLIVNILRFFLWSELRNQNELSAYKINKYTYFVVWTFSLSHMGVAISLVSRHPSSFAYKKSQHRDSFLSMYSWSFSMSPCPSLEKNIKAEREIKKK